MDTANPRRPDLPALTGLRFLAAAYVVVFHFAPPAWSASPVLGKFIGNGRLSVEFFFILSGFILTYVHDKPLTSRLAQRAFWFSRFARIYPVYFLALMLCVPFWWQEMIAWHGAGPMTTLYAGFTAILSAALVQSWVPRFARDWNPAGWSLSAEAFFYACFPFLLPRVRRLGRRQLLWVACAAWMGIVIPRVIYFSLPLHLQMRDSIVRIPEYQPLLRVAEFIGGMAVARLLTAYGQMSGRLADKLALVMAAAILLSTACLNNLPLAIVFFPEVALLFFFMAQADGAFSRLMGGSLMRLLGEASYSVYILQFPLYWIFLRLQGLGPRATVSPALFLILRAGTDGRFGCGVQVHRAAGNETVAAMVPQPV